MKDIIPVGTVCRVRDWDDMAEEYGTNGFDIVIQNSAWFTESMRQFCGRIFTVKEVLGPFTDRKIYVYNSVEDGFGDWNFCAWMLSPLVIDEDDGDDSTDDIDIIHGLLE